MKSRRSSSRRSPPTPTRCGARARRSRTALIAWTRWRRRRRSPAPGWCRRATLTPYVATATTAEDHRPPAGGGHAEEQHGDTGRRPDQAQRVLVDDRPAAEDREQRRRRRSRARASRSVASRLDPRTPCSGRSPTPARSHVSIICRSGGTCTEIAQAACGESSPRLRGPASPETPATAACTRSRSPATKRYSTLRRRRTWPTFSPLGPWIPICAPTYRLESKASTSTALVAGRAQRLGHLLG